MLLVILTGILFPSNGEEKPCREHPQIIGAGFWVHGRLSLFNGAPAARLSKTGAKRILGISDGHFFVKGYRNLPLSPEEKLTWENEIYGDFMVYPFTPSEPNVMQFICIDSGKNIIVRDRSKMKNRG